MYSHKKGDQELVFFGTTHSHNPKDNQYQKLETAFTEFARKQRSRKVLLIEGALPFSTGFASKEAAIVHAGDRGFAHVLANQNNVEIIGADMSKNILVKLLLEQYSLEAVYACVKSRFILMWERFAPEHKPFATCNDYVQYHLQQWFKDIDITKINDTSISYAEINKVTKSFLVLRQKYTFEVIQNYWNQGYDIFIIYGNAHAKAHKKNIKQLLN